MQLRVHDDSGCCGITRCTCAAAAVAARARRLNRLSSTGRARAAPRPAADSHHVLVRQRSLRWRLTSSPATHVSPRMRLEHAQCQSRRSPDAARSIDQRQTRHRRVVAEHRARALSRGQSWPPRDDADQHEPSASLDVAARVPTQASATRQSRRWRSGDRLRSWICMHASMVALHNALHMCCGRGGGASAAAQQAPSTGRARAAPTPAADSHHVLVMRRCTPLHASMRLRLCCRRRALAARTANVSTRRSSVPPPRIARTASSKNVRYAPRLSTASRTVARVPAPTELLSASRRLPQLSRPTPRVARPVSTCAIAAAGRSTARGCLRPSAS